MVPFKEFSWDTPRHPAIADDKVDPRVGDPGVWTDEDEEWLQKELEEFGWETIQDLYEPDELEEEDDEPEEVTEVLTHQGRMKKRFAAIRSRNVRQAARRLALKKPSSPAKLKKRAVLAARKMVYKKVTGSGNKAAMAPAAKAAAESKMRNHASYTASVAKRLQPKMREIETARVLKRKKHK